MTNDILATIDAATGCQQCEGPLGESPSSDFCCDGCQQRWHAQHADKLVGYREPWVRPQDFPGVGTDAHDSSGRPPWWAPVTMYPAPATGRRRPEFRGGAVPQFGIVDEVSSWPSFATFTLDTSSAEWTVTCLRETLAWRLPRQTGDLMRDLRAARRAMDTATTDAQRAAVAVRMQALAAEHVPSFADSLAAIGEQLRPVFAAMLDGLRNALAAAPRRATTAPTPPPDDDPFRRALEARRNRNTGPPRRERPPRRVDPRGGLYR